MRHLRKGPSGAIIPETGTTFPDVNAVNVPPKVEGYLKKGSGMSSRRYKVWRAIFAKI
jgi:hypothetical protein